MPLHDDLDEHINYELRESHSNLLLLKDREKGKFEIFYSTQNRNLNFPAAAAETFKGCDPRKVKAATTAETFKGGHPRNADTAALKAGESPVQIFV